MDGFNTTTAEMTRASGLAHSAHADVTSQLATLRGKLESLRGVWQGDAYNKFALLMERWDTNAKTVSDALASIADAIQTSGAAYQAQEDAGASQMSAIGNALG